MARTGNWSYLAYKMNGTIFFITYIFHFILNKFTHGEEQRTKPKKIHSVYQIDTGSENFREEFKEEGKNEERKM